MNDQTTPPTPQSEPPYQPPPAPPTYTAPPAYTPPAPPAAPAYASPPPPPPPPYGAPLGGYASPVVPGAAPTDYKTAGTFMLIGSITTLIASGFWFLFLCWIAIGFCWLPFAALAVWCIVLGSRASGGRRVREIRLANAFGLVAAVFCWDVVGLVFQILALVWLSKEDVSRWVEQPG